MQQKKSEPNGTVHMSSNSEIATELTELEHSPSHTCILPHTHTHGK